MLRTALPLSREGVSSPQQQGGPGDQAAFLQAPGVVRVHPLGKGTDDFIRAGVSTPGAGKVLAQFPYGLCEQHPHGVRLLPALRLYAESADFRGRSPSLFGSL